MLLICLHIFGEHMRKTLILVLLFVLSICFYDTTLSEAAAGTIYEIGLQGLTWDHANITVLVTPAENESWWNHLYIDSTLDAINEWNQAISEYTTKYPDYAYLSQLTMNPQVSNVSKDKFDVYISWIEQFANESLDIGLTTSKPTDLGTISNSDMILSAHDFQGDILDELDMHAVALHELGHAFGLGHSNVSGDTMYYDYVLNSPERAVSTLNMYGISNVFGWMTNSTEFNPDKLELPTNSVILPSNIKYEQLPIPKIDVISATISNEQISIIVAASTTAILLSVYVAVRKRSGLKRNMH